MRLVVSLPTRGRPQQLVNTIQRNLACLSRPDTLLMVQVDEDDEQTITHVVKGWRQEAHTDKRLMFNVRAREDTIAAKWNRALCEPADVYTCLGDDDPLCTPDADEKILKAAALFPDGIGMVYGHLANASFSGCISFTKKMTELLGYIQPVHFPAWFCDHWTDDIGRMVGRIAFADVRTDQRNVGENRYLRELRWWADWFDANYMVRREHAYRIIEALNEPEWRWEMQRSIAPLVEYRSKWINNHVRADAQAHEMRALPKDDRYFRVKQKAIDLVPDILMTLPKHEADVYRGLLTPPATIMNLQRAV